MSTHNVPGILPTLSPCKIDMGGPILYTWKTQTQSHRASNGQRCPFEQHSVNLYCLKIIQTVIIFTEHLITRQ